MKKNDFNINDLLKKVTNTDVDRFVYRDGDKAYDVDGLIEIAQNKTGMFDDMTLYSCDLVSGKASAMSVNLQCENTDALRFSRQIMAYWYFVKLSDVKTAYNNFKSSVGNVSEDMRVNADVYKARCESAIAIYTKGTEGFKPDDFCVSAVNVGSYFLRAKYDAYPLQVRTVASAIYDELIRLDKIMPDITPDMLFDETDEHDFNVANVKELRRLLVKFAVAFFPHDKDGVMIKYRYKATDARARNLYRLAARLDSASKRDGDVKILKERALIEVIISQVLGAVQYVVTK